MFATRRRRAVAWLGLLALILDALVPIHLALDVVAVLNAGHAHGARVAEGDAARAILATIVGHHASPDRAPGHHRHHRDCAVCGAAGTLAAFAPAAPAMLPVRSAAAQPLLLAARSAVFAGASATPYRSRAPPIG